MTMITKTSISFSQSRASKRERELRKYQFLRECSRMQFLVRFWIGIFQKKAVHFNQFSKISFSRIFMKISFSRHEHLSFNLTIQGKENNFSRSSKKNEANSHKNI